MKVNPKTVKFVLDLIAALAVAASGVVAKYYTRSSPELKHRAHNLMIVRPFYERRYSYAKRI